ncbi:MAG: hypothetical protein FJ288_09955 [Planctomycetes bacterium]|nr:hypothetical protein [Planctomycetota bacterium]
MTAAQILDRVRFWFGKTGGGNGGRGAAGLTQRGALGPREKSAAAYLAGCGTPAAAPETAGAPPRDRAVGASPLAGYAGSDCTDSRAPATSQSLLESDSPSALAPRHPALDPLDPPWIESLEGLTEQIAASAADRAAAARALENIAGELDGHRQAARTLAAAMQRLPDIAAGQADLARETNKLLERQAFVLESIVDALAALRAAFGNIEESSRRNLKAIAMLESSHRQILFEYQTMFLRSHRLVGYLAAAAAMLAAGALGAAAYVAWMALVAP